MSVSGIPCHACGYRQAASFPGVPSHHTRIRKKECAMTPEEKLKEMGIELKEFKPFHPAVAAGVLTDANLLYLSGSTPSSPELVGRVGDDLTVEQGYQAARECAINQLAQAKHVLGDLSRIKRVVKVLGMVNAAPGFK